MEVMSCRDTASASLDSNRGNVPDNKLWTIILRDFFYMMSINMAKTKRTYLSIINILEPKIITWEKQLGLFNNSDVKTNI